MLCIDTLILLLQNSYCNPQAPKHALVTSPVRSSACHSHVYSQRNEILELLAELVTLQAGGCLFGDEEQHPEWGQG